MTPSRTNDRRQFLRYLAASPCIASLGGVAAFLEQTEGTARNLPAASDVISDPSQALDVFDFEEAAHRKVLPGHWAWMVSGVDDDGTLDANPEGFNHVQLRPRHLRDGSNVDMHTDLFGTVYDSPIFT